MRQPRRSAVLHAPADIHVGQVLAGKGSDSDKTRKAISINTARREAETEVFRTLAQWADRDITPKEATP